LKREIRVLRKKILENKGTFLASGSRGTASREKIQNVKNKLEILFPPHAVQESNKRDRKFNPEIYELWFSRLLSLLLRRKQSSTNSSTVRPKFENALQKW
jgi:hypothetical protein